MSVTDFDSYTPVGFEEFLPRSVALHELQVTAAGIIRYVLKMREEEFSEAKPIPNMEEVANFVGRLGLKPLGKISLVDSLTLFDKDIESPGATSNLHRQSFVIEQNIDFDRDDGSAEKGSHHASPLLPRLTRSQFIESAAVHELAHLSGIPDVLYFVVDKNNHSNIMNLTCAPTKLEDAFNRPNGAFFEEGFATLCGYMYLWERFPEVVADLRTEQRRAPNGISVDLPIRHAFYDNPYAYLAWAMEQLTDYSPKIFDILMESRRYETPSAQVRAELKAEIDKIHELLFDAMDRTDVKSLNSSISTAYAVDLIIKKARERGAHEK